jgi:YD repeat-containing protein
MKNHFIKQIVWVLLSFLLLSTTTMATTAQYTYDNLNRLIKVQYDDGTVIQYTYDAVGNRLTQQVQAFSGAAATSAPAGTPVSAPASISTPAAVSSTPESLIVTGAGALTFPAWPALLTRIRLAGSAPELEDLQTEIQNFLDQGAFSPEEKDRYQTEVAQELEARADFIHRTTAAAGRERAGTESRSGMPRDQKKAAEIQRHKIRKNKEKIYTAEPEPELEKPNP